MYCEFKLLVSTASFIQELFSPRQCFTIPFFIQRRLTCRTKCGIIPRSRMTMNELFAITSRRRARRSLAPTVTITFCEGYDRSRHPCAHSIKSKHEATLEQTHAYTRMHTHTHAHTTNTLGNTHTHARKIFKNNFTNLFDVQSTKTWNSDQISYSIS